MKMMNSNQMMILKISKKHKNHIKKVLNFLFHNQKLNKCQIKNHKKKFKATAKKINIKKLIKINNQLSKNNSI